jgi:superfamily II DNA or RNA helicase
MLTLRDYQLKLYEKVQQSFKNKNKRVLVVAPAGAGKSYIFAKMCETASQKGEVLILIHRLELKKQHIELFDKLNINTDNIRIESVFTEVNNLDKHTKPVLIVLDEAHLSKAKSWEKVVQYYDTFTVGFTASPVRLDNKPLGDIFNDMVEEVDVKWLIENKRLAPYEYYAPMTVNTDNLKTSMGDYNLIDLETLMCDNTIYSDVIKSYKELADNEQCIVYCVNIKH